MQANLTTWLANFKVGYSNLFDSFHSYIGRWPIMVYRILLHLIFLNGFELKNGGSAFVGINKWDHCFVNN